MRAATHDGGRRRDRTTTIATMVVCSALLAGCENANEGKDPLLTGMFFPSGLLLDPRAAPGEPAPYLFVANSNNDLSYNAGTVLSIDLERYFAAWSDGDFRVDPYCSDARCVQDVGSKITNARPCRRLSLRPQVVECNETPFVGVNVGERSFVRTGDFATLLTSSCEGGLDPDGRCLAPRIWLPVRGDPSVTYIDLFGEPGEPPVLDCWTKPKKDHSQTEEEFDAEQAEHGVRCAADHRLTRRRNDDDLTELDREPFNLLISPTTRFGYVAHADGDNLTLLALDGIGGGDERPAIVDQASAFPAVGGLPGGLGLAERPCSPDDAPSITLGCTRPLVYAAFRYSRLLVSFTVQGVAPDDPSQCAGPGEDDQFGKIVCDARVRSTRQIFTGGLDPGGASYSPVLGDIAFSDDSGNELLVLQTSPGALLKLDTAVGPDGEVLDSPSAPPLEICEQPTRMKLYRENGQRFALISCYVAAQVFVVDLDAFRVLTTVSLATGPFETEIDEARRLLYIANNLEASISVVDLAQDRPTRFTEIARIGLQEPFSR